MRTPHPTYLHPRPLYHLVRREQIIRVSCDTPSYLRKKRNRRARQNRIPHILHFNLHSLLSHSLRQTGAREGLALLWWTWFIPPLGFIRFRHPQSLIMEIWHLIMNDNLPSPCAEKQLLLNSVSCPRTPNANNIIFFERRPSNINRYQLN